MEEVKTDYNFENAANLIKNQASQKKMNSKVEKVNKLSYAKVPY